MDTTLIFTRLIFGSIGMGYVVYGRKQANMIALLAGVGLKGINADLPRDSALYTISVSR